MASWTKCTTTDGVALWLNMEHVAMVRPYHSDRGFSGSEVIFAAGAPSILVKEDRDSLIASASAKR